MHSVAFMPLPKRYSVFHLGQGAGPRRGVIPIYLCDLRHFVHVDGQASFGTEAFGIGNLRRKSIPWELLQTIGV